MIHQQPTSRVNGVIVSVQLKNNWREADTCAEKIKEQLAYLDNVYYNIPNFKNTYKIYRGPCFQYSDLLKEGNVQMHISLKNIRYPIDWPKLGLQPIYLPIALRFDDYDSIKPIFNRESIQYNAATIRAIKGKLNEVALWFKDKWDNETAEFDSMRKAMSVIKSHDRVVKMGDWSFDVKPLFEGCNVSVKPPSVKGLSLRNSEFYAKLEEKLLGEYEPIAMDDGKKFTKKHLQHYFEQAALYERDLSDWRYGLIVLVDDALSGHFKEYLKEKYDGKKNKKVFYVRKVRDFSMQLSLGGKMEWTYGDLCKLDSLSKDKHQQAIDELRLVVGHYEQSFMDERGTKNSQAFHDWVTDLRNRMKSGAVKKSSTYLALDKQKGEVTVYRARMAKVGQDVVYEKDKEKLEVLHKLKDNTVTSWTIPTVYWTTEQEDIPDFYVKWLMEYFNFIRVNPTEVKHFQAIKHFIPKDKFMKAKPMARLATGLYVDELLDNSPDSHKIVAETFPQMQMLRDKLISYRDKANSEFKFKNISSGTKRTIVEHAKEHNVWDTTIYPEAVLFENKMKPFMFLDSLKDLGHWNTSDLNKKVIQNMMYIMLKHYRINHASVDEFDLVPNVKPSTPRIEEVEVLTQDEIVAA